MRGFSGEQLLAVADEYCAFHSCHVRSFAALAASAAVPGARLHGVPVFCLLYTSPSPRDD